MGRRLPFRRFASWVVALSMIEVVAASLRHALALCHSGGIGWAILLGPVAAHDAGAPTRDGMAAFGTLGLMTVIRIVGTARAQQLGLGTRAWAPLLLTALTWTLTRVGFWALSDLARGRSPAP